MLTLKIHINIKYIFFINIFLLLGFLNITAQNSAIRQLNWHNYDYSEQINDIKIKGTALAFDKNIIKTEFGLLPVYYEDIVVENGLTDVNIVNVKYAELTPQETEIISDDILKIKNTDFALNKNVSFHKKQTYITIDFLPFFINSETGNINKIISFEYNYIYDNDNNNKLYTKNKTKNYAVSSILSTGTWHKLAVNVSGIYKVTYDELIKAGLTLPVASDNIRLFGNGGAMLPEKNDDFRYDDLVENAIYVNDGGDGNFDPGDFFLFYGQGTTTWKYNNENNKFKHSKHLYSDLNYYFLTIDNGQGKRISSEPSSPLPANNFVNTFNDYAFHNNDSLNLIKSGKIWYGEKFDIITTHSFNFNKPNIVGGSIANITVDIAANSPVSSTFTINVDGHSAPITIQPIAQGLNSDFAKQANAVFDFTPNDDIINVALSYDKPVNSSVGWLNFIEINLVRNLVFNGGQMSFRNIESVNSGNISEFTIAGANNSTQVWNITNLANITLMEGILNGSVFKFRTPTDTLKEFVVHNGTSYNTVSSISYVANQNLHGLGQYDMVIVTYPAFISEAMRLADYHTVKSGLSVVVVFPQTIYNEFSSGKQDIAAIRNFMKMFYDRASNEDEMPKYLLLFGDGSYDPKNRISENTNLIPTFQSLNSLQYAFSYVSDDFFGLLDDGEGYECNGSLDIGIGRFPVKTLDEASAIVDKMIRYSDNNQDEYTQSNGCSAFINEIPALGDWRNIITFIADDEDNNLHLAQTETLTNIVETNNKIVNIEKIYLDAYQQQSYSGGQRYPEVNDAINKRVERGALIINYTGHGGEVGWSHERIIELSDINKWSNKKNMPVFVTATCEFSRFDDPVRTSAGELVLLNKNGGGIALFTTTRLAFANSNFNLTKSFYQNVFNKTNGEFLKMGDVIRISKVANGSSSYIRNFVLLGDPAQDIAFPKLNVVTTSVPDTMKALSLVNINGYIADDLNNKVTTFNGVINITVFDKKSTTTTLGNDIGSYPVNFSVRRNIIYKGKAVVENGNFAFSFIVPKDIAYKFGKGKISYYAEDGSIDAAGYYDDFVIGGADLNAPVDYTGPEIKLFMNDTFFISGGITNENPLLIAYINDENGINTVGNGIGHDIVAVLDDNTEKSYVLNDYYEADLNTYKRGFINYPFKNLSEGSHTLSLKVWDVYNNSSETEIEFFVSLSDNLLISKVITYPNPFYDYVSFVFEHNNPCCELNVQVQIFSITGQHIRTINKVVETNGFRTVPLIWNGKNNNGVAPGKGFYIYRLRVTNQDGNSQEKTGKLLLMK